MGLLQGLVDHPGRQGISTFSRRSMHTCSNLARPMTDLANQSIRFGVAVRLLSAFAAITIFAIATSVIALYTFGKYGDGFNRIASSYVPALVAASNLAQRSQALAANAPNLAVADGILPAEP